MTKITKEQLKNMLEVSNQQVIDWFTAMPVENFFTHLGEVWSASENVDHLIKAHQPILGKLTVREMIFFTIYHNLRHASQEGD